VLSRLGRQFVEEPAHRLVVRRGGGADDHDWSIPEDQPWGLQVIGGGW